MTDDGNTGSSESGKSGNDSRIVLEFSVSMKLCKIRKQIVDIVKGMGSVEVSGKLEYLPVSKVAIDLLFQF